MARPDFSYAFGPPVCPCTPYRQARQSGNGIDLCILSGFEMSVPALDPDLLQAFVAVADHRSFTRAAAMLNRTQSAVSMQIKRLEDRLGVELFSRTTVNV